MCSVQEEVLVGNASIDDLDHLVELLQDLFTSEQDFHPDAERQARGLRLILEQPSRGRIFVVRYGDRIIGMINLLITISTAEGGFVLLLEDLIIHPEHRGCGYGTMLIEYAQQFAREKDFLRITLLTDHDHEKTRRFYRQRGFQESGMVPMRYYVPKR